MSVRFDIDESSLYDIGAWMTEKFGPPLEGVTWFWCHRLIKKRDGQGNECTSCIEGIRIWKDCANVSIAVIKWAHYVP
jgi:hypothetical protein